MFLCTLLVSLLEDVGVGVRHDRWSFLGPYAGDVMFLFIEMSENSLALPCHFDSISVVVKPVIDNYHQSTAFNGINGIQ